VAGDESPDLPHNGKAKGDGMACPTRERQQLEADLLLQLRQAAEEFRLAKCEQQRLLEISRDLGLSHPDGRVAMANAMHVYNEKLSIYRRAVKVFTDLTVHGKNPGR
jgi:hypothetical protein